MIGEAYAKVAVKVFDWFLPSNYRRRILISLIGTADGLYEYSARLLKEVKKKPNIDKKTVKMLRHFSRQYKANRKKLK